jgi:predicted MFS family arabinose efflux permease
MIEQADGTARSHRHPEVAPRPPGRSRRSLRLIRSAAFCSAFDRMAIAPMLVAISGDLDASLAQVTLAATAYFLLYGAMQPIWGMLSDRLGRVPVIRLTLAGAAVASIASAAAPTLGVLLGARAVAGALFAGVIPTTLVYVGDTVPMQRRQIALTQLMGATSAGLAVSTVLAGIAVVVADWRLVFAWSALAAGVLAVALRAVPEPDVPRVSGALAAVGTLLRRPWPRTVVLLALVEGTLVLGIITFLAPALEDAGLSAAVAGGVMGLYGAAVVAWTGVVRRAARDLAPARLILVGTALIAVGYLAAAVDPGLGGIGVAALLVAGGFAFLHSTLQTWATEVAPDLRATAVSLFAAALFTGGAVGTALVGPLADDGEFAALFLVAVAVTVLLGTAASIARSRWPAQPA